MARILLMEDEEDERLLLTRILEQAGHKVVGASSGTEAFKILTEVEVDIVVTDVFVRNEFGMVPDGGLKLISRIRQHPHLRRLPIIVATVGYAFQPGKLDLVEVSRKLGADDAFNKPINPDELLISIMELTAA